MEALKFYLDVQGRRFVQSPQSAFEVFQPVFFSEDVESVELYFLKPASGGAGPYDYVNYSSNTVKFAVGTTTPAALQTSWTSLSTSVAATVTSLVEGGSGSNEQQLITLSPQPARGGWAIQFPTRNVTVSSVSANVFTAADHGLYNGQSVSLSAFSFTASAVANGSSYFVIRNSKDAFSLGSIAFSTTALTASASGGGTVTLPAVTTGQLSYNADPNQVESAIAAAGLVENNIPQLLVTGTPGREYLLTFANGSGNRNYGNVSVVGSTLSAPPGLQANVNFATNQIAALISSGSASATLEIEVSGGGRRQTYQTACTLSSDIIKSSSPAPVPTITPSNSFNLIAPDSSVYNVTIDNDGVLTATKQ